VSRPRHSSRRRRVEKRYSPDGRQFLFIKDADDPMGVSQLIFVQKLTRLLPSE
jgi:hypothetical protein